MISEQILKLAYILKTSDRRIYYHGTTGKYLRQILKVGLIPKPPKANFENEDFTYGERSTKTFGGIYLTKDAKTAHKYTFSGSKSDPGVLITVSLDTSLKNNISIDEDNVFEAMDFPGGHNFFANKSPFFIELPYAYNLIIRPKILAEKNFKEFEVVQQELQTFIEVTIEDILERNISDVVITKFLKNLNTYVPNIFKEFEKHPKIKQKFIDKSKLLYKSLALHYMESIFNILSQIYPLEKPNILRDTFKSWKNSVEVLLKLIPTSIENHSDSANIRWFSPISYKGKNRIIGIIVYEHSITEDLLSIDIKHGTYSDNIFIITYLKKGWKNYKIYDMQKQLIDTNILEGE